MSNALRITPHDALILVDVQNDFCPGGALAVTEGDQVVPVLNGLIPKFETVVATRDWHPEGHCSFVEQGGTWPPHCIQNSKGAAYHPDLAVGAADIEVLKADTVDREAFNNFDATPDLAAALRERGITRVFVGGLATDYCVRATVLGAIEAGFAVVALTDAMRAVNIKADDGERALAEMAAAGAVLATSGEIED